MTNIILIHGTYGYPEENWFPWLKENLEVQIPKFPTPENQSLNSWLEIIKDYEINQDTILVGHSTGALFILNLLENNKAKAAFLVSGFISQLNNKFDELNKTFMKDLNWQKIKENCKTFYVFHSDNDPYVNIKQAEELGNKLNTEPIIIKQAGHFNQKEFKELLEKIKDFQN